MWRAGESSAGKSCTGKLGSAPNASRPHVHLMVQRAGFHTGSAHFVELLVRDLNVAMFFEHEPLAFFGPEPIQPRAYDPKLNQRNVQLSDKSSDSLVRDFGGRSGKEAWANLLVRACACRPHFSSLVKLRDGCCNSPVPCAGTGWLPFTTRPGLPKTMRSVVPFNLSSVYLHRTNRVKWAMSLVKEKVMQTASRSVLQHTGSSFGLQNHDHGLHHGGNGSTSSAARMLLRVDPLMLLCAVASLPVYEPLMWTPRAMASNGYAASVTYEELQQDPTAVITRVAAALSVPYVPGDTPGMTKSMPDSLRSLLANFEEIEESMQAWPCLLEMPHAYVHTCVRAHVHAYMNSNLRTCVRTSTCTHTHIHANINTSTQGWPCLLEMLRAPGPSEFLTLCVGPRNKQPFDFSTGGRSQRAVCGGFNPYAGGTQVDVVEQLDGSLIAEASQPNNASIKNIVHWVGVKKP